MRGQILKVHKPGILAGMVVNSPAEANGASEAGASFLCPVFSTEESSGIWMNAVMNTFPVCPEKTEALQLLLEAGFRTFLLLSNGSKQALQRLWDLYSKFPEAGFVCVGPFEEQAIEKLTPFYSVRSVCTKPVCTEEEAAKMSDLARMAVLGFEFAHLGINTDSEQDAMALAQTFSSLFHFASWDNGNSIYASDRIECMKFMQLGRLGHIAIRSNSVARAKEYLVEKGLTPVTETAKFRDGRLHNIYFKEDFGGFAIHLLQKKPDDPI